MAATLLRASSTRSSTSPILTSTQAASMPTMPSGLMGACPASSRSAILLVPAPITGSAEAAGCPDRRPLPSRGCIVGPLPAAGEQGGKPASLAVGEGRPLVDEVAHVPLGRIGLQLAPLVDGDIGLVGVPAGETGGAGTQAAALYYGERHRHAPKKRTPRERAWPPRAQRGRVVYPQTVTGMRPI